MKKKTVKYIMIAMMCTVISAAVSTGTYFALDYADLHLVNTSTQSERSHSKSQDSQNGAEHKSRSKDGTEEYETENTPSAETGSHKKPSSKSSETDSTVTKTKKTGSQRTHSTDSSKQTDKTAKSEKSHSSSTSRSPSSESDADNSSDKSKSGTSEKPSSSAIEDTDDELSYSDFIELYITELGGELSDEEVETLRNGSVTDAINIILQHSGEDAATSVEEIASEEIQTKETQTDADETMQE